MVNYENGKIYKVVCNITGLIYVGSTCENLSNRLAHHRRLYKHYLTTNKSFTTSFEILKNDDYAIVLLEECPCNNKEQLHSRERYYIDSINCVDKSKPTRTIKEWREDNKEKIKERKRENADKIREQMKIYRDLNKDKIKDQNKLWRENNKDKVNERTKKYREENKETIDKRRSIKYTCECGSTSLLKNKSNHIKSQKHILFIENQEKISKIIL